MKNVLTPNAGEDVEEQDSHSLLMEMQMVCAEYIMNCIKKLLMTQKTTMVWSLT